MTTKRREGEDIGKNEVIIKIEPAEKSTKKQQGTGRKRERCRRRAKEEERRKL